MDIGLSTKTKVGLISALVILIIIIILFLYFRFKIYWNHEPGVSYIYEQVTPTHNSTDGNIEFVGVTTTEDQCRKEVQRGGYPAYTWSSYPGPYNLQCYGVKQINIWKRDPNFQSARHRNIII